MARSLTEAASQALSFGSDTSIDAYTNRTIAMWIYTPLGWNNGTIAAKSDGAAVTPTGWRLRTTTSAELRYTTDHAVTDGVWTTPNNSLPASVPVHVVVTQVGTNTPTIYIDGVSQALATTAPAGAVGSDAAATLWVGRDGTGARGEFDVLAFCYDDVAWTAAEVNRHYWWGVGPGGPKSGDVVNPLWDSNTRNMGDATATLSAESDSFLDTIVRLPRPGMMLGVGW